MNLDPRTIVFINIISTMMMGLSLLSVWKVYFSRITGVKYWAGAIIIQSIGWTLYGFRNYIPDYLSIVVANTLLVLSLAIFFNVLVTFVGFRIRQFWSYIPVAVGFALLIYYTYVKPDVVARIIIQSADSAILLFASCYVILWDKKRPPSHSFTAFVFGVLGLILIGRILTFSLKITTPAESIFAHNFVQDISYLSFYVSAVILSFGFILMCNNRYITENNKTEALLLSSEERYRNIVETAQEGIWLVDENYKTVFVNKKMCELLEYTADEMIGFANVDFVEENERMKVAEEMARRKTGISEILQRKFRTKSGRHIWTLVSATPIMLENGKFSGSLAMVTDITDRHLALEALKFSEQQLIEAQIIARLGNYNYSFKTGIWKCSEVVDEISGLLPEEINSIDNWIALIAPEFKEQYLKDLEDTIVHGNANFGHYHDYKIIQAHTGSVRWISITGEIKYDEAGQPEQLIGTLQDITERKKEEELMQMNDQLRNYSGYLQEIREEERVNIAREIHDELGQQLTAIKIEITRWKNKLKHDGPELPESNDVIMMVNNAISSVRKIATELRPGLLNELGIEAAIELYTNDFEKRTGIRCAFEANLEQENFSKAINTAIFRIYQETMTNVARHSKATEVNTRFFQEKNTLVLEVRDNGIGISDERLNNKTSLGLLGMKERAAMLHGEIDIRNIIESGTLVTVKIPTSI